MAWPWKPRPDKTSQPKRHNFGRNVQWMTTARRTTFENVAATLVAHHGWCKSAERTLRRMRNGKATLRLDALEDVAHVLEVPPGLLAYADIPQLACHIGHRIVPTPMWKCTHCDSTEVRTLMWVDPNTEEIIEAELDHGKPGITYCDECSSEVPNIVEATLTPHSTKETAK